MDNDKEVVYQAQIHRFIFVPGVVFLAMAVFFSVIEKEVPIMGLFSGSVAVFFLLKAIVSSATVLAITPEKLTIKMGLIKQDIVAISCDKVESVLISQGLFGRILNFGTLIITGTGTRKISISHVYNPWEFKKYVIGDTYL